MTIQTRITSPTGVISERSFILLSSVLEQGVVVWGVVGGITRMPLIGMHTLDTFRIDARIANRLHAWSYHRIMIGQQTFCFRIHFAPVFDVNFRYPVDFIPPNDLPRVHSRAKVSSFRNENSKFHLDHFINRARTIAAVMMSHGGYEYVESPR